MINLFPVPTLTIICVFLLLFRTHWDGAAGEKDDVIASHAVGIALTATYGTISVKHPDGSFENIGRIDGSKRYLSMMQRLSSPENQHLAPPYSSFEDIWDDMPRQYLRRFRKRLGFPASHDVRILAEMLRPLLDLYQTTESVQSAVISYPAMVALYEEDIVDAAAYLRIRAQEGMHLNQPRGLVAAFAGHGKGLCKHPEDLDDCKAELDKHPAQYVLHVEFTKKAMVLQSRLMRKAHDFAGDIDALALYNMGSEQRQNEGFLLMVEGYVGNFLDKYCRFFGDHYPIVVILSGDEGNVEDKAFVDAIKHVVGSKWFDSVEILNSEPEYIAARGAAELCDRGKYRWYKRVEDL